MEAINIKSTGIELPYLNVWVNVVYDAKYQAVIDKLKTYIIDNYDWKRSVLKEKKHLVPIIVIDQDKIYMALMEKNFAPSQSYLKTEDALAFPDKIEDEFIFFRMRGLFVQFCSLTIPNYRP
jgi:asparagine synthetase A